MKRSMILAAAAGMLTLAAAGCAPTGNSESSSAPAAVNVPETPAPASGEAGMMAGGGMTSGGGAVETPGDSPAEKKLTELEAKLAKSPEDAKLKKEVATAAYDAGYYIEYDKPGLTPREKYRPALKLYNRALELDPQHEKAAHEKKQIEDIYQQMGMPIPK